MLLLFMLTACTTSKHVTVNERCEAFVEVTDGDVRIDTCSPLTDTQLHLIALPYFILVPTKPILAEKP